MANNTSVVGFGHSEDRASLYLATLEITSTVEKPPRLAKAIKRSEDPIDAGIYHFDGKPFIVTAWSPNMDFSREELHSVPIWIKFPGLDFKYWSPKGTSKLGTLIGKPLIVDKNTERKAGLNFARLMVEVDMDTILPESISFKNEKGQLIKQKVSYEWKPTLCQYCKKYGHSEEI
ncbi:hypothetical protein KY290_010545 [Solanum tuberosum]|uniref:DUF4283 domain-containing protein n=1 Tax=Solanum tuberosum TaxID=4113 RepID=A0ABQ7VY27_SOLTU|nr:hypothetical protein KY290_010545 [Solanum tuberosum]